MTCKTKNNRNNVDKDKLDGNVVVNNNYRTDQYYNNIINYNNTNKNRNRHSNHNDNKQ